MSEYYIVIGGYKLKCFTTLGKSRAYKTGYGGEIYEIDINSGLVRKIGDSFSKGLGITIGSMIDHLIADHSENYKDGYKSIYALGSSTEAIDAAHSSLHKGRDGNRDSNLALANHRHLVKGKIVYLENSEDKEIVGLLPIIDGYNEVVQ